MAKENIKKIFMSKQINLNVANSLVDQIEAQAIADVQADVDSYKKVATPVAEPVAGAVAEGTEIGLTCATEGAEIYFTLDGEAPTNENGTLYSAPIVINAGLTIKAIAYKGYQTESDVLEAIYTVAV